MAFEFDEAKSRTNAAKHGIDFVQAQQLWLDALRLEVPARTEGEPRWLLVARIGDDHWSAIFAYRAENTRIISVRGSRKEEIELYEDQAIR